MTKILIIETCFECSHCQALGKELFCELLQIKLRHSEGLIPEECPLQEET